MLEEIDVEVTDLQVGDIVVGAYKKGLPRESASKWNNLAVASKPVKDSEDNSYYNFLVRGDAGSWVDNRPNTVMFIVKRDGKTRDFPHSCPRCGKSAYVGFLEVTHQFSTDCPAKAG